MNYETILEELKRDHAATNDKILEMKETIKNLERKRDEMTNVIADAHASLKSDVNDLTLSEVKAAIDKTRSLLSSLLTKEVDHQTLGAAFFDRVKEIGFDRKVIESILSRDGVHAIGPFVAGVLLGEMWSDNAISFVSMDGPLDFHLEGSSRSLVISSFNGMTWKREEYRWCVNDGVNDEVLRAIFIFSLNANPDETFFEFEERLSKMTIYDVHHAFSKIDPMKVSFDGVSFRVTDVRSLLGKVHHHLVSDPSDHSLVDNQYGVAVKECEVLPEPISICLSGSCTFFDLAAEMKDDLSDSGSLEDVLRKRIESLGIDYASIYLVLKPKDTCVAGSIVTQALLGEKWDVDTLRIVSTHKVSIDGDHHITTRQIIDRVGRDWVETTYTGVWKTPVAVYYLLGVSFMSLDVAVRALVDVQFLQNWFDGTNFYVDRLQALIEKRHSSRNGDDVSLDVSLKFRNLGFVFDDRSISIEKRHFERSSPFDIVSKQKKQSVQVIQFRHFV